MNLPNKVCINEPIAHQLAPPSQTRKSDQLLSMSKTSTQYLPKIEQSNTLSNLEMQQVFDKAGGTSNFSTAVDKYGKTTSTMLPTNMGVKYKSKSTKTGSTEILNNVSPNQPLHQVNTYAKEPKHAYS